MTGSPRSIGSTRFRSAALASVFLFLALGGPAMADTIMVTDANLTATVVCEFNSQTNTFTFTITNTTPFSSELLSIGFDLPPAGNASASGLNGFTGMQAPSLTSNFSFSDAALGTVPTSNTAVLDFGFITGASFASGTAGQGLLPGESASFTVSGAAFAGFTEAEICNSILLFSPAPAPTATPTVTNTPTQGAPEIPTISGRGAALFAMLLAVAAVLHLWSQRR